MSNLLLHMMLAALIAGVVTVAATPLVKKLAFHFGVVRAPRHRDAHTEPTPLWGGLALFVGFLVSFLCLRAFVGQEVTVTSVGADRHPILGILLGGAIVAFAGMLDDHPKYELPPRYQAAALLLGGLVAALFGARIEGITNPFAPLPVAGQPYTATNYFEIPYGISLLVTMAWVFLAAKTFDFLDGLDGLAAGVCAIAATTMGLMAAAGPSPDVAVALLAAALVGACIGFLRHNYNPASVFMGTVGSQFLGFVLATLAVVGAFKVQAAISLVIPLLVLGVPVFDGIYVVLRRIAKKKKPTEADRTHIHHRLRDLGLSVKGAVWAIYGLTTGCCLLALFLAWKWAR